MNNWKAQVQVVNDAKWYGNGPTFKTKEAAEMYAQDLFDRWTATVAWRVVKEGKDA